MVSIITKNGFSQSGAPSGSKCATVFFGLCADLEIMNLSQIGNPRTKVKIRCLEVLKVYGTIPIRLIITSIMNTDDRIEDLPFN